MILHHLDRADILGFDTRRRHTVASAEHITPLDVEAIDADPLVLDLSALAHLDAGHPLQHIGEGLVLDLAKIGDQIADRVSLGSYRLSRHRHLPQLGHLLPQADEVMALPRDQPDAVLAETEHPEVEPEPLRRAVVLYGKPPVRV